MNTIFIINQLESAGAQKIFLEIVTNVDFERVTPIVCVLYDKTSRLPQLREEFPHIEFHDLRMGRGKTRLGSIKNAISGLGRLAWISKKNKVDTMVTFLLYSNIIGPIVGKACGARKIVTNQRNVNDYRPRWEQAANRFVSNLPFVDKVVCVSEGTKNYCMRVGIKSDKLTVIKNGVRMPPSGSDADRLSIRKLLGVGRNEVLLGTIGRLDKQKGQQYLIEAVHILKENVSVPIQAVIVGEGPLKILLEDRACDLGVNNSVKFLGSRKDIHDILDAIDIFVFPSLFEGIPNALIEAMAAGKPIVATDVSGIAETIENMKEGILVPPRDAEALANGIAMLLGDAALAGRLSEGAVCKAEGDMSMDRMIEKHLHVICKDLAEGS